MNKNLVTSLELSQKLEKLGVKQESEFMWVKYEFWKEPKIWASDLASELKIICLSGKREYTYSAFLSGELGEMLPHFIKIKDTKYQLFVSVALGETDNPNSNRQWFVVYSDENDYSNNAPIKFMMKHNLAEAMGKMLCYLIENDLWSKKEKN